MNWIKKLFVKQKDQPIPMKKFLIVGLGNIGGEYVNTRHNIGFKIVEKLASLENLEFKIAKFGQTCEFKTKGRTAILLKPNTFMNLSGKAIKHYLDSEKIPLENLLVIADDLNLSFGTIRIKAKGTDGGHNGLKNTQLLLNTSEYPRFRFGISDAFKKGNQIDYVLGEWTDEEKVTLQERLTVGSQIIKSFMLAGLAETMNIFNGK